MTYWFVYVVNLCIICLLPRLLHCNEYLNTLGELDGFIHSNPCDVVVIVDFNVDLDQCNQITSLLCDFMSDHGLCSCDLLFRDDVKFTNEYDDGLSRSWIDHVICSQSFSNRISDICAMHSGYVLSDYLLSTSLLSRLIYSSPNPCHLPITVALTGLEYLTVIFISIALLCLNASLPYSLMFVRCLIAQCIIQLWIHMALTSFPPCSLVHVIVFLHVLPPRIEDL